MNITNTNLLLRLNKMLGDNVQQYMDALSLSPVKGLHVNTTKCSMDTVQQLNFGERIPEGDNLIRVADNVRPALHPYYAAGLYYMQEPSAMLPVSAIDMPDNAWVLDMCAAPGGKSSQLAIKLQGKGMLVSNDVDRSRAQVLRENIVRMGYSNVLVVSMDTERLANTFGGCFDVVVVDAPCSGEGMFRKEPQALIDWNENNIRACALRQREILIRADKCLKTGGILLYSTCTFAEEEDERIAEYVCSMGYEVLLIHSNVTQSALKCSIGYKYLPHMFCGEGQYFCAFVKRGQSLPPQQHSNKDRYTPATRKSLSILQEVADVTHLNVCEKDGMLFVPAYEYNVPCLINGVMLGKVEKDGRLTPSHQLFTALGNRCNNTVDLQCDDMRVKQYLGGEEIATDKAKGWCCVSVYGFALGGGKASGTRLKNHYPKHLRIK